MDRTKPVQEGIRVKPVAGTTWESLKSSCSSPMAVAASSTARAFRAVLQQRAITIPVDFLMIHVKPIRDIGLAHFFAAPRAAGNGSSARAFRAVLYQQAITSGSW